MERVVDRIMKQIVRYNVNHVFMVTGGGAMFINDAVDKCSDLDAVYLHHEQSCAMAAVAYGKTHKRDFGVAVSTSGCGATNMMTGLLDAWQDGVPCLFISGNANSHQIHARDERHYGVQDLNIEPVVTPMTKAFFRVTDPSQVDEIMDMAVATMLNGNPGPVWIEIPIDIQGKQTPPRPTNWGENPFITGNSEIPIEISEDIKEIVKNAKRLLFLLGRGVKKYSRRPDLLHDAAIVTTFAASDLYGHWSKLGCIGLKGDRSANIALYYADVVICLGTSLSIPAIGYNFEDSLKHCKHIIVVDKETNKFKKRLYDSHIKNVHLVNGDAYDFGTTLSRELKKEGWSCFYNRAIRDLDLGEPHNYYTSTSNKYDIREFCSKQLIASYYPVVTADAGSVYYIVSKTVAGSEYIAPIAQAEMGAALPYAIGAYYATGERVAAYTGDGSLQMNIQDLGALTGTKIDLYVMNNNGYLSIRSTQNKFFDGGVYGTDVTSGLSFPDLKKICGAYGISYARHYRKVPPKGTHGTRGNIFNKEMVVPPISIAQVNEVMCNPNEDIIPRVEAQRNEDGSFTSYGFKNMYPFLSEEEMAEVERKLGVLNE